MHTTFSRTKQVVVGLLAALYFFAANGMVLEYASKWYSTGGKVAIGIHSGPSKDLPVPTLTERSYLPEWSPLVVPSIALLVHAFIYSVDRPLFFRRDVSALPSYTAFLTSRVSDRAPPAA